MKNAFRAHTRKVFETLYDATFASTLAFGVLMILLLLVAMAVGARGIDVRHIHTAPDF
jgi:hypothetical protein